MMTSIVTFTLKILLCLSFFLYFSLIVLFVFLIEKSTKRFTPSSLLLLQLKFISQEHPYKSAYPWFFSSLISLRYTTHTNQK